MATHTREQAALRTEHAPQHSEPNPGAWPRISEQDKVQLWKMQEKMEKSTIGQYKLKIDKEY